MAEVDTARLQLKAVSVRFGSTQALDGVDLTVGPGEVHALIGQNGAGKSTLMKVLSGAVLPDSGSVSIDGSPYRPRNPRDARLSGIAMIYQELSLAPHLTAVENIFLGMEPHAGPKLNRAEMKQRALEALNEMEHMVPIDVPVQTLSISDKQVVEIARAAAVGCNVLILDEPTSSLTQADVDKLFRLIRRLKDKGYSIIYISHFMEEIKEIADRFTVLRDGKTVGGGTVADVTAEEIVTMMVGDDIRNPYHRSPHTAGDAVLEIKGLSDSRKIENIDLTLHRGEVLGIFGLVGSGRTELFRTIFGLDSIKSGLVKVGKYSGFAAPAMRWKQGVGMVSEDRKNEGLALSLSIADNLVMSHTEPLEKMGLLTTAAKQSASAPWIEKLSVRCQGPEQKIGELSGGNQQKIAIARLLHHNVDVLLLDEPTRGIDIGSKKQIYELIDELALANKAVLVISSYLPELMGICDRIAVMSKGKLTAPRAVDQLNEHSILMEAIATTAETN
jgi:ribose transport system ATP-binding protein